MHWLPSKYLFLVVFESGNFEQAGLVDFDQEGRRIILGYSGGDTQNYFIDVASDVLLVVTEIHINLGFPLFESKCLRRSR